jgi:hypothetical protein
MPHLRNIGMQQWRTDTGEYLSRPTQRREFHVKMGKGMAQLG